MSRNEKVKKVIDGDTFETASRKHLVRLANVAAPEKGKKGYAESKRKLKQLIDGERRRHPAGHPRQIRQDRRQGQG